MQAESHLPDLATGERLVEGYYPNYPGIWERLKQLHNLVVVEMMDTVLATYRVQDRVLAEEGPLQHEFVMH